MPDTTTEPHCSKKVQGMSLVPSVTELIMAELLYLQYDNAVNPINMYINSTGVTVRLPLSDAPRCLSICRSHSKPPQRDRSQPHRPNLRQQGSTYIRLKHRRAWQARHQSPHPSGRAY